MPNKILGIFIGIIALLLLILVIRIWPFHIDKSVNLQNKKNTDLKNKKNINPNLTVIPDPSHALSQKKYKLLNMQHSFEQAREFEYLLADNGYSSGRSKNMIFLENLRIIFIADIMIFHYNDDYTLFKKSDKAFNWIIENIVPQISFQSDSEMKIHSETDSDSETKTHSKTDIIKSGSQKKEIANLINQASKLSKKGEHEKALKLFMKAGLLNRGIKVDPQLMYLTALEYYHCNRVDRSKKLFLFLTNLYPDNKIFSLKLSELMKKVPPQKKPEPKKQIDFSIEIKKWENQKQNSFEKLQNLFTLYNKTKQEIKNIKLLQTYYNSNILKQECSFYFAIFWCKNRDYTRGLYWYKKVLSQGFFSSWCIENENYIVLFAQMLANSTDPYKTSNFIYDYRPYLKKEKNINAVSDILFHCNGLMNSDIR